jgi:hypothetical protein
MLCKDDSAKKVHAMTKEPNEMQQVVSRTLRDSLGKLQRSAEDLNQAVADLVSACASTRPANSLSPILRAQTAAASLDASLEVLARFVTSSLQLASVPVAEETPASHQEAAQPAVPASVQPPIGLHIVETPEESPVPAPALAAPPAVPVVPPETTPLPEPILAPEPPQALREAPSPSPLETVAPMAASDVVEVSNFEPGGIAANNDIEDDRTAVGAEFYPEPYSEVGRESFKVELKTPVAPEKPSFLDPPRLPDLPGMPDLPSLVERSSLVQTSSLLDSFEAPPAPEPKAAEPAFNLSGLPPEEQELHRRANRVAKVSMQDIKMLRPNDVRLGKEQHDLCWRLRDDLEKAHREYDRRFQTIMVHPVDYFYDWLVEILADGDPGALGEYPYPSPVLRH